MNDDLIRRSDAIEAITYSHLDNLTREERIAHINAIPSADRPQGEWVQISPAKIYECSVCGQNVMTGDIEAYKWCHGCGCRMKGADDE